MKNLSNFLALIIFGAGLLQAQQQLSITITNKDLALIRETRTLTVSKGMFTFRLEDVPQRIITPSILVESKDHAFQVLEQNFEYDLYDVETMLNKFIGRQVEIVHPDYGTLVGKLLSVSSSHLILQDQHETVQIIPRNDEQKIVLKDLSLAKSSFVLKPTLVWKIKGEKKGSHQANLSYLTRGISWEANYVMKLHKDEEKSTLAGWITINNQSGRSYKNATIKLMAGELNIYTYYGRKKVLEDFAKGKVTALPASSITPFKEKPFFEYHLYSLQWPTTLNNKQEKQIQFLNERTVPVKKVYRVLDKTHDPRVLVFLKIKNSQKNNLGIALPEGVVRMYKEDGPDLEFIGEHKISHTPKDEYIELKVGEAFDVTAERIPLKSTKPTQNTRRQKLKYILRNHKDEKVTVEVLVPLDSFHQNELLSSSIKVSEITAKFFKFIITLQPDEERSFTLEYLTTW